MILNRFIESWKGDDQIEWPCDDIQCSLNVNYFIRGFSLFTAFTLNLFILI